MKHNLVLLAGVIGILGLAGCSDSSDSGSETRTQTSQAEESATTTDDTAPAPEDSADDTMPPATQEAPADDADMGDDPVAEEPATDDTGMDDPAPADDTDTDTAEAPAEDTEPVTADATGGGDAGDTAETQTASSLPPGDAARGQRVFVKCMTCHVVQEGMNRVGPSLYNVVGRTAGSLESFPRYSQGMKNAGIVWTEETLDPYLENPRAVVPGGSMAFAGLPSAQDRADVIAYLRANSPDAPPAE